MESAMPKTDTPDPDPTDTKIVDEPVEMTKTQWNGITWTTDPDDGKWDFTVVEALEQGRAIAFLRAVLGRRQFARFEGGNRRTARDARELMDAIMAAHGEANSGE